MLRFCSLWASGTKTFIFLACREHINHERNFLLTDYISRIFTWLFLHHKEVTRVIPSTSFFAWQFSHKMKLTMRYLVEPNSLLKLSYRETRSWSVCLYFCKCCSVPEIHETPKIWHPREQNYLFVHFSKGLFTWSWGTPGRWGNMWQATPPNM